MFYWRKSGLLIPGLDAENIHLFPLRTLNFSVRLSGAVTNYNTVAVSGH